MKQMNVETDLYQTHKQTEEEKEEEEKEEEVGLVIVCARRKTRV